MTALSSIAGVAQPREELSMTFPEAAEVGNRFVRLHQKSSQSAQTLTVRIAKKKEDCCFLSFFDALGELVLFFFLLILLQISCYEDVKGHANDPYLTAQPQFIIFVFG